MERARTQELLRRFLPAAPAVVLDVGGGAGAYALWLAELGYAVHLIDAVARHVEQARAAPGAGRLASAAVGDARALPFADASCDAVLLLGPLYHLTEAADRAKALSEAGRVLRPGGRLIAAGISRFAPPHSGLFKKVMDDPAAQALVDEALESGRHLNPTRHPSYFTTAFFHRPEELRAETAAAGFTVDALLAVEGPASFLPDVDFYWKDERRRARLLALIARLEAEPSLLGASSHFVAVARR